ncbi:Blue light- and temperature-regulated antirepressor BluF [Andreprevotia sp. IGB-42]|uniref:BLUF domain-containing protein n=1 Tax=Andreprevotia sp. IGB-42 TaxID=2497473 RepID=UPI001357F9BE|nr:BLUF domain-containing protein [Andreprevotia sp. IGB-42]KAF0815260.1 Blue light- and temperature-regulated antirepressor BluF [Andreprevotia sp. IGB-42]
MLVRLIYASRAKAPITTETINGILLAARKHNPDNGITGILAYGNETFLQVLEGGRQQVNQLYGQLIHDERHTDVTLLDLSEIDCRQYANWSMGRGKLDRVNLSLLLKYSANPVFDPYSMSGKAVACLVQELVASASFVTRD